MAKNRPFKRGFAKNPTAFNEVYVEPALKRMAGGAPECRFPACHLTATTRVMLTIRGTNGHPVQTDLCEHHFALRSGTNEVRQIVARFRPATPAGEVHVAQVHSNTEFDRLFDGGRVAWVNDMPVRS